MAINFTREDEMLAATQPIFHTRWPLPGKRWAPEAKKTVGVYALVWKDHAYIGMTVSSSGFQGRWAKHHRALFVRKRSDSTTKLMRSFIKEQALSAQDFHLLALQAWPLPMDENLRAYSDQIALVEQAKYDEFEALGFTMLNNVRPRGTGYTVRPRKRKSK